MLPWRLFWGYCSYDELNYICNTGLWLASLVLDLVKTSNVMSILTLSVIQLKKKKVQKALLRSYCLHTGFICHTHWFLLSEHALKEDVFLILKLVKISLLQN